MKNASPNSNPAAPPLPPNLQTLLDNAAGPEFDAALTHESIARARRFLEGIKTYRHHPARRDVPEMPVIWSEGTTKLRDYNPSSPAAPILLVIPSLINRFDILDLDYIPSFLRTLAAAGFRPLVVDWDEPGESEQRFTLEDYVERLTAIIDGLNKNSSPFGGRLGGGSGENKIHLIGYCMGGLLALALAALRSERVKTLTLLATPWDFHQPDPAIGQFLAAFAKELPLPFLREGLGEGQNASHSSSFENEKHQNTAHKSPPHLMPVDILQTLFALLQPFQAAGKFVDFAGIDPQSMEARQFVLLEDWLNGGVPLPARVAEECLKGWYGENRPANFAWKIDGAIIDPRQLAMPSYVVVPGRDKIVPPESALPLAKLLPRAALHEPMVGHIGMMASRTASQQVWKPLLHWLETHA